MFWFDCIYYYLDTYLGALRYSIKYQIQAWLYLLYIFKSLQFMAFNNVLFIIEINIINLILIIMRSSENLMVKGIYICTVCRGMVVFSMLCQDDRFWEPNHTAKAKYVLLNAVVNKVLSWVYIRNFKWCQKTVVTTHYWIKSRENRMWRTQHIYFCK